MRIAGGEWRGRTLKAPPGDAVRPTQDRVRGALFSMIHAESAGAKFLDLFAGAGSVGLEALSRGAARTTFVESNPRHAACLAANVAALGAGARAEIVRADAFAWPTAGGRDRAFDVAFADPPYALVADRGYGPLLTALAEAGTVRPGGLFVAEMATRQAAADNPAWELCRDRAYGQTRLAVYRRLDASQPEATRCAAGQDGRTNA